MGKDVRANPWIFDGEKQGEGFANVGALLRRNTFTTTNATNRINYTAHGYLTGDGPIQVEEGTNNDLPSGLAESTDYFIIRLSADTFSVALTRVLALAGTAVEIADDGTIPNYILQGPNNKGHIFIKEIKVYTGTSGGDLIILDKLSGRQILFADKMPANTTISFPFGDGFHAKGIYISDLQTAAIVYVYHGAPSSGGRVG